MKSISNFVKNEIEKASLQQFEVAKNAGWSAAYLSQLLSKDDWLMDDKRVFRIFSQGIGMSRKEALEKIAEWKVEYYSQHLPENWAISKEAREGFIKVLFVDPKHYANPSAGASLYCPKQFLNEDGEFYAFKPEFLLASIPANSIVFVKKTNEYSAGKIHVFKIGGEAGMGRVLKIEGRYNIQDSTQNYPQIPVNSFEFEIIGVVVATFSTNP